MPRPASLRGLVTLVALLTLLPALAVATVTGYFSLHSEVRSIGNDAQREVAILAARQTRQLHNSRSLLTTLAGLAEVRSLDAAFCSRLFRDIAANSPHYVNLLISDSEGRVLASARPDALTPAELALVQKAGATGFQTGAGAGQDLEAAPMLNCLLPFKTADGGRAMLLASVAVDVGPSDLSLLISRNIRQLWMLDASGRVVFQAGAGDEAAPQDEGPARVVWERIRAVPQGDGTVPVADGSLVAFGKIRLTALDEAALTLAVSVSTGNLYARTFERTARYGLFMAAIVCASLLATVLLCNSGFVRPLRALLAAAQCIKSGDFSPDLSGTAMPDELRTLADSLDNLAVSLAERDAELKVASDIANTANKAKTEFLANLSHEIRTPMNAILGMTYLAQQEELNEQQRGYLENIHAEAGKLLVIINDILDFSKLEAGKLDLERVPFDLLRALSEVRLAAEEQARRKGLVFSAEEAPDLPRYVRGDPVHFSQVLSNILINAVKVTEEGQISLHCEAERPEGQLLMFVCRVRDTAGGMQNGELDLYFPDKEPEGKVSTFDAGAGLNLAVTRRLVHLMQGSYAVESEPGVGSTVTVRLPLHEMTGFSPEEETAQEDVSDADVPEADLGNFLKNVPLLVVEDNPVNQQIAEEILRSAGAVVYLASSGREALNMLAEEAAPPAYRAILMDLQMPDMDGLTTTRRLRTMKRWRDVPVIAMTAHSADEEWRRCADAGMNDFATKPLDVPSLLKILYKWVVRSQH